MKKIFYFSATGNCLWSAKKIAQLIEEPCELHNIGIAVQENEIVIEAEAVILVFPSYAFGLPLAVREFVKKAVFKTSYIASFVTFGSSPMGTLGELRKILKKKFSGKTFFGRIPAVENYLAMFGSPSEKTLKLRLPMQEKATIEAACVIREKRENKVNTFRPFSSFVSLLFLLGTKVFYKHYRLSSNCNGCAVCEKICPVSAIVIKDKKPVFTSKCEHCQACVNNCPLRAIQFWRVKFGAPGYRHPEIEIKDLVRGS